MNLRLSKIDKTTALQQETVEVDGEWYISVKGIAKAYGVDKSTIHKQLNTNQLVFEDHVQMTQSFGKKSSKKEMA